MTQPQPAYTQAGGNFIAAYARSWWRLPVLLALVLAAVFVPLYMVRGMRLVELGALAIAAAVCAAVSFSRPFESTVLAIFLGFSGLDLYLPGPVTAGLLALALVRVGLDALDGKRVDLGSGSFGLALAVLLTAAWTSLLAVERLQIVTAELRNIALGLAVYVNVAHFADRPRRLAAVMLAVALALAVSSALPLRALAAGGAGSLFGLALTGRIGGLGIDPNLHAGDVNCAIPLLIAVLPRFHGWKRWALMVAVPLLVGSVILSQSRAGVLLLTLLVLVMFLRAGRVARWMALAGLVALGVVALSLPRGYWVRFESIGQLRGIVVDRSLILRQHVGQVAWEVFREHPWIGVGLGNFRTHAPRHMLGELKAHNSYLEIAANLGLVGLSAYLAWLASGVHMAWRAGRRWRERGRHPDRRLADGIVLALFAFGATALTLSIEFSLTIWTLLGLAASARHCAEAPRAAPGPAPGPPA